MNTQRIPAKVTLGNYILTGEIEERGHCEMVFYPYHNGKYFKVLGNSISEWIKLAGHRPADASLEVFGEKRPLFQVRLGTCLRRDHLILAMS